MKLLALDIAADTGFAFGDDFKTAHCNVWKVGSYADDRIDATLGSIYSAVNTICRGNKIEGVVIEAALRGIKRQNKRGITTPTSSHGDRCLTMLHGAARAGAANAGVKTFWFPAPNTWRAAVLGNGFPKNPKAEALLYCERMGRSLTDHNAAEALCMLQFRLGAQNLLDRIKP